MTTLRRFTLHALAVTLVGASLSACAPLLIGGAAVGTLVAVDRRTSGTQLEDETIELRAASRLREALGDRAHINVTSYNRQVLLTGEVPDAAAKQTAEQVVSRVENVRSTVNEVDMMLPSSLTQRATDTYITGRVKAALIDDKQLSVSAFKVVTERGTVFLMGRVTQREADRVAAVVRNVNVNGLKRVVRVFEIISEEDLARIAPKSAAPASAAR